MAWCFRPDLCQSDRRQLRRRSIASVAIRTDVWPPLEIVRDEETAVPRELARHRPLRGGNRVAPLGQFFHVPIGVALDAVELYLVAQIERHRDDILARMPFGVIRHLSQIRQFRHRRYVLECKLPGFAENAVPISDESQGSAGRPGREHQRLPVRTDRDTQRPPADLDLVEDARVREVAYIDGAQCRAGLQVADHAVACFLGRMRFRNEDRVPVG